MALVMQGPLVKQGIARRNWRQRWFVLTAASIGPPAVPPCLAYYANSSKKDRLGLVELAKCTRAERVAYTKDHEGFSHLMEVEVPGRVYRLLARASEDVDQWLEPLSRIIEENQQAAIISSTTETMAAAFPPPANHATQDASGQAIASTHFCRGCLTKLGANVKTWKRRWFLFKGNRLSYYREKGALRPLGIITMDECLSVKETHQPGLEYCFAVQMPARTYLLAADDGASMQMWLTALGSYLKTKKGPNVCRGTGAVRVRSRSEALRPSEDHTESSGSEGA